MVDYQIRAKTSSAVTHGATSARFRLHGPDLVGMKHDFPGTLGLEAYHPGDHGGEACNMLQPVQNTLH